jgi:hypothetical protein
MLQKRFIAYELADSFLVEDSAACSRVDKKLGDFPVDLSL